LSIPPAYYRRQAVVLRTQALAEFDAARRDDCLKLADHFETLAADVQAWKVRKAIGLYGSDLLRLF